MLKEIRAANFPVLEQPKPKAQGTKGSSTVTPLRKPIPGKITITCLKINY